MIRNRPFTVCKRRARPLAGAPTRSPNGRPSDGERTPIGTVAESATLYNPHLTAEARRLQTTRLCSFGNGLVSTDADTWRRSQYWTFAERGEKSGQG